MGHTPAPQAPSRSTRNKGQAPERSSARLRFSETLNCLQVSSRGDSSGASQLCPQDGELTLPWTVYRKCEKD